MLNNLVTTIQPETGREVVIAQFWENVKLAKNAKTYEILSLRTCDESSVFHPVTAPGLTKDVTLCEENRVDIKTLADTVKSVTLKSFTSIQYYQYCSMF